MELAQRLQSVADVIHFSDSLARIGGVDTNGLRYATVLATTIRNRFYHGYSHYSLQENWLAALAGYLIREDLSAIVIPDDILKYPMAACSQQSIVMMACFKEKGVDYRKVAFKGHYTTEACIKDNWYYFDTNLEPDFSSTGRESFETLNRNGQLVTIYQDRLDSAQIATELAFDSYGRVNALPAPRAELFHIATRWASRLLWLIPLFFAYFRSPRRQAEKSAP